MENKKTIEVLERYITNTQEEIDWYQDMNIPLQLTYKYKSIKMPLEEISDVRKYKGSIIECVVYFNQGGNTVCLGNADEMFIRMNDLKNNEVE